MTITDQNREAAERVVRVRMQTTAECRSEVAAAIATALQEGRVEERKRMLGKFRKLVRGACGYNVCTIHEHDGCCFKCSSMFGVRDGRELSDDQTENFCDDCAQDIVGDLIALIRAIKEKT